MSTSGITGSPTKMPLLSIKPVLLETFYYNFLFFYGYGGISCIWYKDIVVRVFFVCIS